MRDRGSLSQIVEFVPLPFYLFTHYRQFNFPLFGRCLDLVFFRRRVHLSDELFQRVNRGYRKFYSAEDEATANCDYSDVPSQDLAKARILFPTVASVIGRNSRAPVTSRANFYELGGNSLNSVYTVTKLRDQGYQIGITDFITAKSLADVLDRMKLISDEGEEEPLKETIDQKSYIFELLHDRHKEDAIE